MKPIPPYFICAVLLFVLSSPLLGEEKQAITVERVVDILVTDSKENLERGVWLQQQHEKAYPIFLNLLKDPSPIDRLMIKRHGETHPNYTAKVYARIFSYVKNQRTDRSQFIQPALENLRNDHVDLRMYTFELLDEIGRERDSVPFVAMLEQIDPLEAGKTAYFLEKHGGRNELLALDAWIRAYKAKCAIEEVKFPDIVVKYRDRLKARLDKEDSIKPPKKPPFPANDESATPLARVLAALRSDADGKGDDLIWLVGLKEKAFPALDKLLADPKTKPGDIRAILLRVKATDGERGVFVPRALACLSHDDVDVRIAALGLLQVIGTKTDTSPVVALLSDESQIVVDLACETLATIGGENDLIAMDIWFNYLIKKHADSAVPGQRFIQEQRNKLKSRIEKANASNKAPKVKSQP